MNLTGKVKSSSMEVYGGVSMLFTYGLAIYSQQPVAEIRRKPVDDHDLPAQTV